MLEIEPQKLLKSVTHSTCYETSLSKQKSKYNYLFSIMIKKSKKCNFLTKNLNFISQNNNHLYKYFIVVYVCICVLSHFSHVWLSQLYGPYPARLLCPWDSPGKNTGVGCHVLLQGSSQPRDQTHISHVSCIYRWVLYHQCHLGSPMCINGFDQNIYSVFQWKNTIEVL